MPNVNTPSGTAAAVPNISPPPLNISADQVEQARAAGYSDDEIANYLTPRAPEQFAAAQKAGYSSSEIIDHLAKPAQGPWSDFQTPAAPQGPWTAFQQSSAQPQPSGYIDQMKQGVADAVGGVGKTLDVNSTAGGKINAFGKALEKYGASWAPANFVPADLVDAKGFHLGNIGKYLARGAPATGATVGAGALAAFLAPELGAGAALTGAATLGAGAGTQFAMNAGNEEQQAADNAAGKPNAPVTDAARTRGLLTAGAESALTALPITRYLPDGSLLAKTGAAGAVSALKKLGITSAEQAGASGAAAAAHDIGQTVGTPQGTTVAPMNVMNAMAGGAATGALFGGPKTARTALDAIKYSKITPDLQPAATQVANRVSQNADGANLQGSLFSSGGAQRAGEAAVRKTGLDIQNELSGAVSDLRSRVSLPVDADNVLKAAMNGQQPTQSGYSTLEAAVANDPQGANVVNLVRQAHAFDVLNDTGRHIGEKFTGGLGGTFRHILSGEHVAKSALVGVGAAAFEEGAGHLIAYSPQVLGAALGGAVLSRMMDNVTGAQAPAGRFVRSFGNPEAGTRLPVAPATQAPTAAPSPFPAQSVAGGPGSLPMLPPAIQAQMKARAGLARLQQPEPEPSPFPTQPIAGGPGTTPMLPPALKAQMAVRAGLAKLQKPAAEPQPALNPMSLPTAITGPAKTLMKGVAIAQKMRDQSAATPAPELNPMTLPRTITGPAANIMRGAALAQRVKEAQAAQEAKTAVTPAPQPQAPALNPMALPTSITGPVKNIVKGATLAQKLSAQTTANATNASSPRPASVRKVDSNTMTIGTGKDTYKVPVAPYSQLPTEDAANRIMRDTLAAGVPIKNSTAFLAKTIGILNSLREKVTAVAQAAPSIPPVELARFEGVRSQKAAIEYRDRLAAEFPAAAPVLNKVFSDDAIATQWGQKR